MSGPCGSPSSGFALLIGPDFPVRLALQETLRAYGTDQIHEEWTRDVGAGCPIT
ncbi:MAG: hypothetical protein ABEL97_11220 [Salinibacter sp.]